MFTDPPQSKKWLKSPSPILQRKKAIKFLLFLCVYLWKKPLQKWSMVCLCVFSMDSVYEDSGDVDSYIDSCGDYTVWQLQVPSCWLFFWNYRLNQCLLEVYFLCWIHTFIRGGRGISACAEWMWLDFKATWFNAIQANVFGCGLIRAWRHALLLVSSSITVILSYVITWAYRCLKNMYTYSLRVLPC